MVDTVSELHRFLFEGMAVRGSIVRLTDAWQEVLRRRASHSGTGAYPLQVRQLLGEMAAASILMQGNIKFNGALILQIMGDGPVKLAVAESRPDLGFRCTATVRSAVADDASLSSMVNPSGGGRCALTLDPQDRLPGQQPYQGVVPLVDAQGHKLDSLSSVLEHYMRQSEQLDTCLVLAANDETAAGLLVQRLPSQGEKNLGHDDAGEAFERIRILTTSITAAELLGLEPLEVLHRLYWQEPLLRHEPQQATQTAGHGPHFACTCSRERVSGMIRSLGVAEVESILSERPDIEVACEFCGRQYSFDAVDAAQIFKAAGDQPPASASVQ